MTRFNPVASRHSWRPLSDLAHPREMVRQFTPNWFAVTMGTGVAALIMPQIPGAGAVMHLAGELLWLINATLFVVFAGLYGARWLIFPQEATRIFAHGTVSMFFGTIPMGLATIVNGCIVFGLPRLGPVMISLAEMLWWVDVGLSLACGVVIPYLMFTRQEHKIDDMSAVWLLPVVAAEVAAVSGGLLAPHLTSTDLQFTVLATSYALWAYSVPVAFSILVILLLRMALHKLPSSNLAASTWLSLGPIGTASLGMLVLGNEAPAIFAARNLTAIGDVAQGIGIVAGICLWGAGLWWLLLALLVTRRYFKTAVPFNLGWWGYIFPLGVYTLATLKLGSLLDAPVFSIAGAVFAILVLAMWALVMTRTARGAWRGHLFMAPCIAGRPLPTSR